MSSRLLNKGFTLIEVLIAIVILTFIAIGVNRSMVDAYRIRDVLLNEGDFFNGIRLAMGIVQRDVALIYTPTLILPPKPAKPAGAPLSPAEIQEQQEIAAAGDLSQSSQFYGPAVDKTGVRPSRFMGSESKMSFLALSHLRVYKNSQESDFAKVSYELQRDEESPESPDTLVLYKIESTNAFDLEDKKGTEKRYPILRGIKKARFKYYQYKDKDLKPHNSWDSTTEDFKNIYPDMIEFTVEVAGPSNLNFEGTFKMRPEIPLRAMDPSI